MEAEERSSKKRKLNEDDAASTSKDQNGDASSIAGDDAGNKILEHEQDASTNGDGDTLPVLDETVPLADSNNESNTEPPMSKNQQKKLRKQIEWDSKKDERKAIRKQKLIAKRERKRARREQEEGPSLKPIGRQKSILLPVTVLIDCDFDDLMKDPELKSLAAQVTRSYSDNRKAPFQAHLAICSFGGKLRERFDNVLTHYKGWRGVKFLECDFVEAAEKSKEWMVDPKHGGELAGVFSKFGSGTDDSETQTRLREEGEIVYLTSESDTTLTELRPFSTYIIGGLVDKNREKGICYKRALKRGVKTARLPIGEFMDLRSRKVLATNHVNEIIVRWLECGDWGEAFMKVIPKRKGGKLKVGVVNKGDKDEELDPDEEVDDMEEDADDEDLDEATVEGATVPHDSDVERSQSPTRDRQIGVSVEAEPGGKDD